MDVLSNGTDIVNVDHQYGHISLPGIIVMSVLLSVGAIFNIYTGYVITQTRINSLLSKLLLYNQTVLDALYCIMMTAFISNRFFEDHFPDDPGSNTFICYLLQSGYLVRVFRTMIVCNNVCQSADRFWAIVYAHSYRANTKLYVILCSVSVPVYSILVSAAQMGAVQFVDDDCQHRSVLTYMPSLYVIEIVFRYALPLCTTITLTLLALRKLGGLGFWKIVTKSPVTLSEDVSLGEERKRAAQINELLIVQKTVFCHTGVLLLEMTVLEGIATTLTVLGETTVVNFEIYSPVRLYYLFLSSLVSALNPCLTILTFRNLRMTMFSQLQRIRFWNGHIDCRSRGKDSSTS
ncbi:unnamed protein product [Echinostoma caproni]|uniref:G_PROTEIN_RECEP_F1_2 domain-containing protein n=1 Tax=Echinostoma caproni TaxID=27848 RepID=A0A183AMY6_9TREM|nr:unnamed protein product [Echinostoma caproni]